MGSPTARPLGQHSRPAVGDELLQLGQVDLPLHGLRLRERTHVQRDDVFGQHLGARGLLGQLLPQGSNPELRQAGMLGHGRCSDQGMLALSLRALPLPHGSHPGSACPPLGGGHVCPKGWPLPLSSPDPTLRLQLELADISLLSPGAVKLEAKGTLFLSPQNSPQSPQQKQSGAALMTPVQAPGWG